MSVVAILGSNDCQAQWCSVLESHAGAMYHVEMNIAAETAVSLFVCFDGEMQKLQLHTIEPMKLGIYWYMSTSFTTDSLDT
ncbi:hypothetical protein Bca52824_026654 [Brassica carinata]|uniref:Uncharacterized protein n=1 Tax=Brassica carinata TaxID=52824 RepID=A0A8X7VAB9_BRACI|nr:hypothetical protein Bca52824_026654 [Brassica carinata]